MCPQKNILQPIHLGEIIREKVKRSGMSITEFAEKINLSRPAVYQLFEKQSIDCELIRRISILLEENLFSSVYQEVQNLLPESQSKTDEVNKNDDIFKGIHEIQMKLEHNSQELSIIKKLLIELKVERK